MSETTAKYLLIPKRAACERVGTCCGLLCTHQTPFTFIISAQQKITNFEIKTLRLCNTRITYHVVRDT